MPLNQTETQVLRKHLIESLSGEKAHITIDRVLEDFPLSDINKKIDGIPYSSYDLVEHIRLAQADIVDFIKNPDYKEMNWPDEYWPKSEGTEESWDQSIQRFYKDRDELIHMIEADSIDLFAPIPHADKYNIFREIIIMANHNSYHTGQLLLLKRALKAYQ